MPVVELVIGSMLIGLVLHDVFNTVILPRPSPARYRPAGVLTRWSWRGWKHYAERHADPDRREQRLGIFAPAVVMLLLGLWMVMLIGGFGLLFHALARQIAPVPLDLGTAMYFAAVSLLTLGYGDFVPTQGPSRAVAIAAAGAGLGIVALTITYLFSLYASFQRREVQIVTLDARAGAPPSAVALLETCAGFSDRNAELQRVFEGWERWSAEVLESHLAYPILMFFRSTHDHESWVSAVGALLDAATLVITAIEDGPAGQARAMRGIGAHLVEDIARSFRFAMPAGAGPGIERAEFDDVRMRLAAAGYRLIADGDAAWAEFARLRSGYATALNALAGYLDVPPAKWIGDRSYVFH
ncbi:MAG TPA: potassium channel family protein [Candidatus Limnocylindria bacterium]|nr:potassium channel family protein [Candidatus Limnocylindria bacterium]